MEEFMRHNNIILIFLFSLTLFAFGFMTEPVRGQEAPRILVQANAPGWITVSWEHTGLDVYYFAIERQNAPYTDNSVVRIALSQNRTDSVTDKNLQANTLYKYHVCAVYAYSWTCSDWVSVRTLSAPTSSSSASSGGAPAAALPPLATPEIRATQNQDPRQLLLDWSGDPGWVLYTTTGDGLPLYKNPQVKHVVVYESSAERPKSIAAAFDSLTYPGLIKFGGAASLLWLTTKGFRPNTFFIYKVCFTSDKGETKCSKEIMASGRLVAPTAPVGVVMAQDQTGVVKARWTNPNNFIPGQFITLEREDGVPTPLRTMDSRGRMQTEQSQLKPTWIQIGKINDYPDPSEPNEITPGAAPKGLQLRTEPGNNYRVCVIVPELGAAGKVCSSAAILRPSLKVIRPVDQKRINTRVLVPKKP
jgi:hypothetical protein